MRIYVASSWRCQYQPAAVGQLRILGHEVYDFRGAGTGWGEIQGVGGGFSWSEVDPDWKSWSDDIPRYLRGLDHPRACEGFNRDMSALMRCDVCLLVNPCGQSAHAELGWACGARKSTAAYCPEIREPDLMLKMADLITDDWDRIEAWLKVEEIRLCPDCRDAKRHAYLDATTPGFFFTECDRHRAPKSAVV